jgi:GYF domain 2
MSNRSWFFASQGQQQGPYPEVQLREFIANGSVTAETLVWTEGMAGWQKAGEIPGLLSGGAGPPTIPQSGGPLVSAGGHGAEPLSIELGLWSFLGRSLVFILGLVLVIPAPWAATSFYRWMASRVRVPLRPNFAFTGQVGDIWYVFVAIGLLSYAGLSGIAYLQYILIPVQAFLSWMTVRWIAANLSSNGERLPIEFKGSALGYVGWYLLMYISIISIIGWAWVITAWMRWTCRNVNGTRREIVFNATGWGLLWRTLLFGLGCGLLIPIPWVMRWYTRWYVSQFVLVERTAYAHA